MKLCVSLRQGWANYSAGPESQRFMFCRLYSPCCNHPLLPLQQPQTIHRRKNRAVFQQSFTSEIVKTEFHILFTYLKVLLIFDFFKTFKNRKPVFICGLYKNSVRFEPADCNLTSPASH